MMNELLKAWTKPAGLMVLGALVIWLGQLNWHALQSTAQNAQQDLIQREILAKQVEVSQNVHESALLLSILMDEMKELREKVDTHQTEAEMWKERIRQNAKDHP